MGKYSHVLLFRVVTALILITMAWCGSLVGLAAAKPVVSAPVPQLASGQWLMLQTSPEPSPSPSPSPDADNDCDTRDNLRAYRQGDGWQFENTSTNDDCVLPVTDAAYETCKPWLTPGFRECQEFIGSETHSLKKASQSF